MRFTVTFGQKYRHHPHPTFLYAHPDGYVVIDVPDDMTCTDEIVEAHTPGAHQEALARSAAFELLGSQWAFLYPMSEMDAMQLDGTDTGAMFPRGQIGLIEQQHGHWVFVEPHKAIVVDPGPYSLPCWCRIRADHDVDEPEPT